VNSNSFYFIKSPNHLVQVDLREKKQARKISLDTLEIVQNDFFNLQQKNEILFLNQDS
jgi:hypothetical protein